MGPTTFTGDAVNTTAKTAKHAAKTANILHEDSLSEVKSALTGWRPYLDAMLAANDSPTPHEKSHIADLLSPQDLQVVQWSSMNLGNPPGLAALATERWARGRVVYAIDTDLAEAVLETDWADTPIPGDLLARLPHPNPMVVLPEPIDIPAPDGSVDRFEAFIVVGAAHLDGIDFDVYDPRTTMLKLWFIGHGVDANSGRPLTTTQHLPNGQVRSGPSMAMMAVSTPLEDLTMSQRREWIAEAIKGPLSGVDPTFPSDDAAADASARMIAYGLGLLVYLVTDEADTEEVRVRGEVSRRKAKMPTASPATRVIEVGYRIGAALRSHRLSRGTNRDGAGNTVAPHIRRAHLHTFRRGPGHSERFVKWLPPIAVNADGSLPHVQVHLPTSA